MGALERIIDANANRAREALRVMEDAARFALDDERLCREIKSLRHDLLAALGGAEGGMGGGKAGARAAGAIGLDRGALLASRDTPGDVGKGVSTASEMTRAGVRGVAGAAAARLTEALRSIEESLKALGVDARPIEALRYRAYTAERDLVLALGTGRAPQWRLCVLVTEALCRVRPWEEVVERAIRGGADCFQLREKSLPDRELLARARRLVGICREAGAAVVVNDRPDIALLARADGVHVGQEDLGVEEIRRLAGFGLLVGVSTTDLAQARAAVRAGADLCGVGPMFPTTTKAKDRLAGPASLREYLADPVLAAAPHLAIGGIGPANIGELAAAGCRGVAVSSAVCGAEEPEAVCAAIVAALRGDEGGRDREAQGRTGGGGGTSPPW